MYNQAQGVYPQVAGSFYNVGGMSPHDNGRVASQIPTFSGAFSGLIGADYALNNFGGLTMGQSPMQYRAAAMEQQMASRASIVGGLGTGIGLLGGLASFTNPVGLAAAVGGAAMYGYKERMDEVLGLRNALTTSVFNTRMIDPFTGTLRLSTANQLTDSMRGAGKQLGMSHGDLSQVLTTAGSSGLLANSSSVTDITKRVMDLAKISKEIMQLGEGITAADAMELQKLMNDMGVSGGKLRTMGIGKNLVTAARATGMSLEAALQISGQGASTYQQLGLGAAAGLNAGSFSLITANALSRSSNMDPTMLRKLGGAEGLQQALLGGTASTMARFSDAMMLGALKLDPTGAMSVDFDLVDRFAKGHISTADLVRRGKSLTANMSTGQKNKFMEQLSYSMPDLKAQMSDMVNPEQTMAIQGRQILELANKSGISIKQAAHSYFQDAQQAEAFLAYASDFKGVRQAGANQRMITQGDDILRLAAKARRSDFLSKTGRFVAEGANFLGDAVSSAYGATIGAGVRNLADTDLRRLEAQKRGLRLLGSGYLTGGDDPDTAYEARDLGFDVSELLTESTTQTADLDKRIEELAAKEFVFTRQNRGDHARLIRERKGTTDNLLKELGLDEDEIVTFYGTDISEKVNRVMGEDSVFTDIGEILSGLAPFESSGKVHRVAQSIARVRSGVLRNRRASKGTEVFDPGVIEAAASKLREHYAKFGKGEGGTAFGLNTVNVGEGSLSPDQQDRLRYLADQYNIDQGNYSKEEEAGRAKMLNAISDLLGTTSAGLGQPFTADELSIDGKTISAKGLDAAIVQAKKSGMSPQDISAMIDAVRRGAKDQVSLGRFSRNPAAVELLKVLSGANLTTGSGDSTKTKGLKGSKEETLNAASAVETRFTDLAAEERRGYEDRIKSLFSGNQQGDVIQSISGFGNDRGDALDFRKDVESMLNERGMDKRSANYNAIMDYARSLQSDISSKSNEGDRVAATADARRKLIMKLNDLAQGTGTNPGAGQGSADLPSIMSQIRDGLTNFNTAMQQIAASAAGSDNKVVTVQLKPAAS